MGGRGSGGGTKAAASGLQGDIRDAYQALVSGESEWVSIANVRERISGTRAEQDAALRLLEQKPDVNIVPQANEKALSDRTRRGGISIGGQWKTHIAIIKDET